ncbi:hypothetical protein D0V11_20885 [Salmonella enterica]|nr:hypothetical protein [Salmonella enterica]
MRMLIISENKNFADLNQPGIEDRKYHTDRVSNLFHDDLAMQTVPCYVVIMDITSPDGDE